MFQFVLLSALSCFCEKIHLASGQVKFNLKRDFAHHPPTSVFSQLTLCHNLTLYNEVKFKHRIII